VEKKVHKVDTISNVTLDNYAFHKSPFSKQQEKHSNKNEFAFIFEEAKNEIRKDKNNGIE
jgi:hypothetical protein